MLLLVLIITVGAGVLLHVIGALDDPRDSIASILDLQMEFFESDMGSSWSQLTVMGIDLSEDSPRDMNADDWTDVKHIYIWEGEGTNVIFTGTFKDNGDGIFKMDNYAISGDWQ